MGSTASFWEHVYLQAPLALAPVQFATMRQSPFTMQYLTTVLRLCPEGRRACEVGFGAGYASVWLSLRGVAAEGIDLSSLLVERARQANNMLGGTVEFRQGDLFAFWREEAPRYSVIHHQGVLERFTVPQIRAALAQQVAMADRVVFSVASVFYPFEPEAGDERLLPLEEWERILAPFTVEELRYYGDPQHGEKEHILCVLRGQEATPALKKRFQPEPFLPGVSAIVHTRNEAAQLAECLETLRGWTDEIIVCDMESTDGTPELARTLADQVLAHPLIANFDRARNVSAMRAHHRFIFYLDADERVPQELGRQLRDLAINQGDTFEGMLVPFRHHFAGRWLQCLYPGYTMPRLFKNGRFFFNTRLHAGAQVDGHTAAFPADNPELALVHYSYSSMAHYLEKLNRYTDGEAANMHRDGQPFAWHAALRHFTLDLRDYYDRRGAFRDGPHGFAYSFLSAFYRFEQHIKLFEKRFKGWQLTEEELAVPQSAEQMLEYMLAVVRERPRPQPPQIQVRSTSDAVSVVWSGPVLDPSGYGEESRHFALALEKADMGAAVQVIPWSEDRADMADGERETLHRMAERTASPGFLQVIHNFAPQFVRHSEAGVVIGRTLFETDRLPSDWVKACNRMDYVWVASEFNRETFAQAGVDAKKLVVIPECFDPAPFLTQHEEADLPNRWTKPGEFTFLAVFDWTLHKGWDVLLRAFLRAFEGGSDCALLLKVWSTMGYSDAQIRQQAAELIRAEFGIDLEADGRIRFVQERLTKEELIALYRASDAYALPGRGEGWGRPFMEAMACGKPVLATGWSGNLAFMTPDNSYLCDYDLVPVPERGWREIPTYRGHRWAEPRLEHVIAQMRRIAERPEEAKQVGERAREEVTTKFSQEAVGEILAREIARIQEARTPPLQEVSQDEQGTRQALEKQTAPLRVRWEGVPFQWHSLAHVNREACLALLAYPEVELSLVPTDRNEFDPAGEPAFAALPGLCFAHLSGPADIHVRHFFPPRLEKPDEGKFVLMQPWEYGFLPTRWIEPIREHVDEVWCYSNYVKQVYLASGIPEEKLQVVPLGVDTTVFNSNAPPYIFTTEPGAERLQQDGPRRFTFLFVGGTLDRKGIDILLEAYLKAFSAFDEVALVIKDTGTKTVYRGQNEREKILAKVGDEFHAPLVYTSTGQRVFDVAINGTTVLSNFDIVATAGSNAQALVEQFTAVADGSGNITITFTTITDNPQINGIQVLSGSSAGVTTNTYDPNGNLQTTTDWTGVTTYTWDSENRLTSVANELNGVETYTYAADGMRRKKVTSYQTTNFLWDGQNVLQERSVSNLRLAQYTDYPGKWGGLASCRQNNTTSFYGFDSQANTRILVNIGGTITDNYSYQAFGLELSQGTSPQGEYTSNPYRYIGQFGYYREAINREFVRARTMDMMAARWFSRDPIGFAGRDFNLYRYVKNSPVNLMDPSGLAAVCTAFKLISMSFTPYLTAPWPPSHHRTVERPELEGGATPIGDRNDQDLFAENTLLIPANDPTHTLCYANASVVAWITATFTCSAETIEQADEAAKLYRIFQTARSTLFGMDAKDNQIVVRSSPLHWDTATGKPNNAENSAMAHFLQRLPNVTTTSCPKGVVAQYKLIGSDMSNLATSGNQNIFVPCSKLWLNYVALYTDCLSNNVPTNMHFPGDTCVAKKYWSIDLEMNFRFQPPYIKGVAFEGGNGPF